MIEKIECRQQDMKNNPYQIQKIFLLKEEARYYIGFCCKTEEQSNRLFSAIDRLRLMMKDAAIDRKIGFSFAKDSEIKTEKIPEHSIFLKGNILEAVKALVMKGVLEGNNRMVFQDREEEAIQNFLQESAKAFSVEKSQNLSSSENRLNTKGCTLF